MADFCSIDEMAKAPPYTKVYPNLFIGSKRALTEPANFDVYISAASEIKPPKSIMDAFDAYHIPLDDKPWDFTKHPEELQRLVITAHDIAVLVKRGNKVLIFCHMGMNRSGLMTALTLMNLGYTAKQALAAIRKRHGCTLSNKSFVQALPYAERMIRGR